MKNPDQLILVNEYDEMIGTGAKITVHQQGLLHRAFSVIVINKNKEILLQKRAATKYHSGGLWSNTCCSHANLYETTISTATKRLTEEMGISCHLEYTYSFKYYTYFSNGLIENEIDHVFIGYSDTNPTINHTEAEDFRWITYNKLIKDITLSPQNYTYWFKRIAFDKTFTDNLNL